MTFNAQKKIKEIEQNSKRSKPLFHFRNTAVCNVQGTIGINYTVISFTNTKTLLTILGIPAPRVRCVSTGHYSNYSSKKIQCNSNDALSQSRSDQQNKNMIKIQYGKVNLGKPIIVLCDFDFDHRQHFDVECCCGNIAKIFF